MHPKCRVIWHHLLLHAQALNLNQVLHFLLARHILKLPFELLRALIRHSALFHLKLHVVEDAVKVDRVQLDWHLHSWVLLEMHKGSLALLWVHHTCDTIDALSLLHGALLAIKHHQLD